MPVSIQEVEVVPAPPPAPSERGEPAPRPMPPPDVAQLLREAAERQARVRAH
ncbi:MAG TPA: hypothetical protein VG734_12530 [Lacunisphaera sp.]|nr:hypothetical protein [Lacunisphaera sp.]